MSREICYQCHNNFPPIFEQHLGHNGFRTKRLGSSVYYQCHGFLHKLIKMITLAPKFKKYLNWNILFFQMFSKIIICSWTTFYASYKSNIFYATCYLKKTFEANTCQLCWSVFKTKCDIGKHLKLNNIYLLLTSKDIWILELFNFGARVVISLC